MKLLITYTYYQSKPSDINLNFFVKKELKYRENIDYIIVINGYKYNKKIIFPKLENLTILKRENKGFDFGGHKYAIDWVNKQQKKYDYYFFMNSCVFGPVLPPYFNLNHWSQVFIKKINVKVKLVGTTIVCLPKTDLGGFGPKVEGFFFVLDQYGLDLVLKEGTIFYDHKTKTDVKLNGKYALSKCILKNGYSIDCMLPRYKNIDWLDEKNYYLNNNKHPSRKNSFYCKSINPYNVIFHKWYWHNNPLVNFNIIKSYLINN